MKILVLLTSAILFLGVDDLASRDDCTGPMLSKDGFGQKPPGLTPILFSPEFIRTRHKIHSSPTFSPDLDEVYWSVLPRTSEIKHGNETILFSMKVNGSWTKPEVAPFSGKYLDGGPLFSADGQRLYFYSKRPLHRESKSETEGEIWYVEKAGGIWGQPEHVKLDFEGEKLFFSVSGNSTLYFTSGHGFRGRGGGAVDIYQAKYTSGGYATPERLSDEVNSRQCVESDPLVSPDERFLIFYSLERPENIGQYDLYVSSNMGNDHWSKPANLGGQVNTGYARFPRFSPDRRYLFFVRSDGVYWVDCGIIHDAVD